MKQNFKITGETVRSKSGAVMINCSLYRDNILDTQTVMSIDDYCSLLQGAARRIEKPTSVHLGTIPDGFHDGYVTNEKGSLGGIFYVLPQKRQFILDADTLTGRAKKAYHMPMPGLVYALSSKNGHVSRMQCFAFKEWRQDSTVLYEYPFGNVSADHEGNVCMGNIKSGKLEDFSDLMAYVEKSLYGITNNDYLDGNLVRLATQATQHDFCDSIEACDTFPMQLLLNAEKYGTVLDLKAGFFASCGISI